MTTYKVTFNRPALNTMNFCLNDRISFTKNGNITVSEDGVYLGSPGFYQIEITENQLKKYNLVPSTRYMLKKRGTIGKLSYMMHHDGTPGRFPYPVVTIGIPME